jgi:signal transduction histidine kinase
LLFNVVKHSGVNQASIEVTKKDGRLAVSIRDRGRGFEPEEKKNQTPEGSQLGLKTIRERLKLMGGEMKITSKPDDGTEVAIYLSEDLIAE